MLSRDVSFLVFILASSAISAYAQTPAAAKQQAAPFLNTAPNPPRDSRTQILPPSGMNQVSKPGIVRVIVFGSLPQTIILQPNRKPVCYSIRSYNFEATDPASGVTKLKGATTCELASNSHLKDASHLSPK